MLKALLARVHQGHRTTGFPATLPGLPPKFQGRPEIRADLCAEDCGRCGEVCPTGGDLANIVRLFHRSRAMPVLRGMRGELSLGRYPLRPGVQDGDSRAIEAPDGRT